MRGLETQAGDDDFIEHLNKFDVIVLTETHLDREFDTEVKFPNYIARQAPGVRLSRLGRVSGGVMLLVHKELDPYTTFLELKEPNVLGCVFDNSLWNLSKNTLLLATYIHPQNSKYYSQPDIDIESGLESIENILADRLQQNIEENILILGDLNSRIGLWAYEKINTPTDNWAVDKEDTINFPRKSEDEEINAFGKLLIELCISFDLIPTHGLKEKNFDSTHTYISQSGRSVVDHCLCSEELLEFITEYQIVSKIESDHFPTQISIKTASKQSVFNQDNLFMDPIEKICWDPSKADSYRQALNSPETRDRIEGLTPLLETNIYQSIQTFTEILKEAGQDMKKQIGGGRRRKRNFVKNVWFDSECRLAKKEARRALNKYTFCNDNLNKDEKNTTI